MCGIAGYYNQNRHPNKDVFEQMVDMTDYRGPDDRGTYYEGNLAMGHRRLSIIDLSKKGHQPFFYKDRYVVVYNGEIYNYLELRDKLVAVGYSFKTQTDTEVLVAAFDKYGFGCVEEFNGMWAFAIYDRIERCLFLSRDRFGVKPLYYYHRDGIFIFASEEKQIIKMAGHKFVINRQRLMEYLVRGIHDHTEETMFRDIMQLRGGCSMLYHLCNDRIVIKRYYDIGKIGIKRDGIDKAARDYRSLFEDSVCLRLRSDVPVGYCLSGGLDSSSIVCVADSIIKRNGRNIEQKAISSCFDDKQYDEREYIDEVLNNTSVKGYKVFPQGENVFEELDNILWHMDEPFVSTSIYAQWDVFKAAGENNLKVMLDGQGADELLAGYTHFYSVLFSWYLKHMRIGRFVHEFRNYKKLRSIQEKYLNSKNVLIESLISAFLPVKLQKYGKINFYYLRQGLPFEPSDIKRTLNGIDLYPTGDSRQYIIDNINCNMAMLLHYEDRNSMAHSIESRVPFLDFKLVESALSMPMDYKVKDGITKYVLREGLKDILPTKIRTRYSKLGFVTPEDKWINENPNLYKKEVMDAADVLSPILDKNRVMIWYDRIKGNVSRTDWLVWRIICVGHWVRLFDLKV